ncbi:MAG TPA: hypothetical protein VKD90_28685 [Gemmataceae bacterium]|nr:hypothetical protein [Gemmataceae bacterium]
MVKPRVYADFHNADPQGRVRLTCVGTEEDLARQGVRFREGLQLILYSGDLDNAGQPGDLLADGVATYSKEDECWVATVDWAAIRLASDERQATGSGRSEAGVSKNGDQANRGP